MSNYLIDETLVGTRIDKFLTEKLNLSRSKVQTAIKNQEILVNETVVNPNYLLKLGDEIRVALVESEPFQLVASALPLEIVFENDDFLVINKPAGLVVHPGAGGETDSVVARLLHLNIPLAKGSDALRPGIVHRLDKDTSGLLLIAKSDDAYQAFTKKLAAHEIVREYTCLVFGQVVHDYGTIDAPIGRDSRVRQKMTVTHVASKEAITTFEVIKRFQEYTLLKCRLKTGRTHQIRVHLNYINHPIVGDLRYGRKHRFEINRQVLHASYLSFHLDNYPDEFQFRVELPADFQTVLKEVELL